MQNSHRENPTGSVFVLAMKDVEIVYDASSHQILSLIRPAPAARPAAPESQPDSRTVREKRVP